MAFNGGDGVFVQSGSGNLISSNSIHSNTGLGIDLGADGVTANDTGDPDTGANNLQNYPVLTSALVFGSDTKIKGTLDSTASTTFGLEFFSNAACDASGNGEGETFVASSTEATDGSGDVSFTVTVGSALPVGRFIAVTATDPSSNTSEFSACEEVLLDSDGDGVPNDSDNCPAWPNTDQSLPPWAIPPGDPDCDGFTTDAENFMGTLPQAACAATNTANDEALPDAWPYDFNDDQRVAIGDVIRFIPVFNSFSPNAPYDPRYDLNASGGITLADVIMYIPVFNLSCTP
ncbi:MAG: thrombospondin type 3 repeat-containing protein [Chloroflexi bacterium]|nr:thrombospondin type 3 repeat-containing protein [Chloroflexota bacterium]